MKHLIRLFGFWYGCIGTLCALAWYLAAALGKAVLPSNVWLIESLFGLHALAAIITFHRTPGRRAWAPMLRLTPVRIWIARILLALAAANFVICSAVFFVAASRQKPGVELGTLPLILASFVLLNTIYITVHWGFRPENLFPAYFLQAISNPLGLIWVRKRHS